MSDIDFGTYHHTTPEESKHLRECAEKAFSKLLRPLYPSRAALRILDAGCGLGFLTYVAAKCFPKASVTGIDLFRHDSVSQLDGLTLKHRIAGRPLETELVLSLGIEIADARQVNESDAVSFSRLLKNGSADLIEDVSATAAASAPGKVLDHTESSLRRALNLADRAASMNLARALQLCVAEYEL